MLKTRNQMVYSLLTKQPKLKNLNYGHSHHHPYARPSLPFCYKPKMVFLVVFMLLSNDFSGQPIVSHRAPKLLSANCKQHPSPQEWCNGPACIARSQLFCYLLLLSEIEKEHEKVEILTYPL